MRKLIVIEFITLDGVMQAPGGPEEDTSLPAAPGSTAQAGGGFKYGGWTVPYFDEVLGKVMAEQMGKPFDLLLGKKTYEIFASYWPHHEDNWPGVNSVTKYVASDSPINLEWENSVLLKGDVVEEIKKLKANPPAGGGPDLHVYGSGNFVQTLLKHDLVDELWLKIFPITLGSGKRLFAEGTIPAAFTLEKSLTTPHGVIVASYKRGGDVKTGSFD